MSPTRSWSPTCEVAGDLAEYALADLDARGMFVITLQPINKAGDGPKSRLVIGDENPNPVKSIGAIRDPGNPKQVIVSWLPSDNTLKGTCHRLRGRVRPRTGRRTHCRQGHRQRGDGAR